MECNETAGKTVRSLKLYQDQRRRLRGGHRVHGRDNILLRGGSCGHRWNPSFLSRRCRHTGDSAGLRPIVPLFIFGITDFKKLLDVSQESRLRFAPSLTQPVSGGAKWIKFFPSFDRISHPFGCLLQLAISQQEEPPSGGQTPLEKKPCIARYARSHQHSWRCRLLTAAHAQGTMDFSGATTLMATFKTFAIYAGSVICFGGLIFAGIRMMSGRFQDAIPGLFGALLGWTPGRAHTRVARRDSARMEQASPANGRRLGLCEPSDGETLPSD